jgi:hypothetical protein
MKLSLPPKLVGKLVCVLIISFCKISFLVMHLTYALLCRNWPFLTTNCLTLQITLIYQHVLMTMTMTAYHASNTTQDACCINVWWHRDANTIYLWIKAIMQMSTNKVNAMATHAQNINLNKITYILGGFTIWFSHSNNWWFKVWLCAQLCDNGGWIFWTLDNDSFTYVMII